MQVFLSRIIGLCWLIGMNTANAGIPVIDPTAIASSIQNAVQSYTQALKEYQTLQQQYAQMQQLENIASGSRGFNQITNNPQTLSNISSDLNAAMSNIKNSAAFAQERAKYPSSNNAKENALYDQDAMQKVTTTDYLSRSAARVQELQAQKARYDTAVDPAGRAEAANAIAANKAILEADNNAMAALKEQQMQQKNEALAALDKQRNCLQHSRPSQAAACR